MSATEHANPLGLAKGLKVIYGQPPSEKAEQTRLALVQAVAQALDRKARLGQYAVFWQDGKVVHVGPEELRRRFLR